MDDKPIPTVLKLNLRDRSDLKKKISPTYLSSDLHSPNQNNRITVPSLGLQVPQRIVPGGKTWGENVSKYGGIGNLPFNGKTRVRDLLVSRNQKHFNSGFSRYETENQPYMLTAFKYSGCRQNDQVLPQCFKIGLNPRDLVVFDGSPIIPYFSHNSKHEVFPRHDPERSSEVSMKSKLCERTRKSLHDYYKYLYETPIYVTTYPNHMTAACDNSFDPSQMFTDAVKAIGPLKTKSEDRTCYSNMMPLLANLCILSKDATDCNDGTPLKRLLDSYISDLTTCFSMDAYEEFYKVIKSLRMFSTSSSAKELEIYLQGYHLNTIMDILDGYGTNEEKVSHIRNVLHMLPEDTNNLNTNANHSLKLDIRLPHCNNDTGEICTEQIQESEIGVSPCWPPSSSYSLDRRTMQLKSTGSLPQGTTTAKKLEGKGSDIKNPLPKLSKRRAPSARRLDIDMGPEPSMVVLDESINGPGLPEYKEYIYSLLPSKFDERGITIKDDIPDVPNMTFPIPKPQYELDQYTGTDKLGRKTYLPPISLSDCLPADGDRIQDRLGLKFKTEAHKRFHSMYPDEIPDLRDNTNYRKRYFFNGYHTSALRG